MTVYQFLMGSQNEDVIMSLTMPGASKPFTKVTKGVAEYLDDSISARAVDSYKIVNSTRIDVTLGDIEIAGTGGQAFDDDDDVDNNL